MYKRLMLWAALVTSSLACPNGASSAEEYGSSAEAKAMLQRAIAAVKADKGGAIAKFNHNDPAFRDRDLFVFCFNRNNGKFTAHEAMVDWDVRLLQDIWGSPFGEQMFAVKNGETIEVAYLSPVPGSPSLVPRRAYVTTIDDQACGVSAYQLNGQTARTR